MDCSSTGFPVLHPFPGLCSNSCPLSQWCHPTISSSAALFSFYLQSFPASGSLPLSWLFASNGPRTGVSASASVLPMTIQGWFPLGLTSLILLSKVLSRVFFSRQAKVQCWVKSQTLPDSKWALKCTLCLSICPTGQQRRLAFVLGAIFLGGGGT